MLESTIGDQLTTQHREAWTTFSTTVVRAYKIGRGEDLHGIFETDPVPFTKRKEPEEVLESAGETESEKKKFTDSDVSAAKTIQKHFRGHHVRKRTKAVQKGTKVNLSTKGALQDSWGKLEGDQLQHGLKILSRMFLSKPDLLDQYSFKEDKAKCAYYVDFHGNHTDVPARNWFLLFRLVSGIFCFIYLLYNKKVEGERQYISNREYRCYCVGLISNSDQRGVYSSQGSSDKRYCYRRSIRTFTPDY